MGTEAHQMLILALYLVIDKIQNTNVTIVYNNFGQPRLLHEHEDGCHFVRVAYTTDIA